MVANRPREMRFCSWFGELVTLYSNESPNSTTECDPRRRGRGQQRTGTGPRTTPLAFPPPPPPLAQGVAASGLPVVCVLHQPNFDLLQRFHRLLLVCRGAIAFAGPVGDSVRHFAALGHVCPTYCNPADFFTELLQSPAAQALGTRWAEQQKAAARPHEGPNGGPDPPPPPLRYPTSLCSQVCAPRAAPGLGCP